MSVFMILLNFRLTKSNTLVCSSTRYPSFSTTIPNTKTLRTRPKGTRQKNKAVYKVELSVWMSDNYPSSIPGMTINAQCNLKDRPKLPMYNSLDLIKRAGLFWRKPRPAIT